MSADSVPSSKTNIFRSKLYIHSSIVAILELIRGAQCLIEVIRSFGDEMRRIDAYKIPYYSRGTLVATSADSVPSSYLVRITIAPIGTTFGNLQ